MPEKTYNPQEPVTITMPVEQWLSVLRWLQYGADYHQAKKEEWLSVCADKRMAAKMAGMHDQAATKAAALCKNIEAAIYPAPPAQTE